MDAYLKDYDVPTLESLIRQVGHERALSLLKHCDKLIKMHHRMDRSYVFLMVKEHLIKVYGNIYILINQALILFRGHSGAHRFFDVTLLYLTGMEKTEEEIKRVEEQGDVIKFDNDAIKQHIDINVYKTCYYLAWLHRGPQPNYFVKAISRLLREGELDRALEKKCLYLIPSEARWVFAFTMMLESMMQESMGQHLLDMIITQCQKDRCRIKFKD